MTHNKVEYCFECTEYPCDKYQTIDDFDSFITHKNQKMDLEKMKQIGIKAYNEEQAEKIDLLNYFLENYNDGRKKTFFSVAINLLPIEDLRYILEKINSQSEGEMTNRDVINLLSEMAEKRNIEIKLRKVAGTKK